MSYAEASYPFPGATPAHFQHIAARDEHLRLERKRTEARKVLDRRHRVR